MKYKHALFLNPYTAEASSTAMGMFPPTGLEYIAASVEGLVGKLTLIDLRYEKELCDTGKLLDFIKKEIDVICATITWNRHYDEACDFLNLMPEGIPLVVGGYKATANVEEIFERCRKVDIVVRGEGEETIKDVVKGVPLENIPGISYRKGGKVFHNENRPLPEVNAITPPNRSLRRNKYRVITNGVQITGVTFDTVMSARGCPFNCKFCTFNLNPLGQKRSYAARSVESVVKEIEGISADFILFCDDNFATEPKRAEKICDLLIERGIKKRYVAQVRLDIARHPVLLDKMVKVGFKMLLLGIESAHDYILEAMDKGFNREKIREYFKVFRKYNILYHGYYIYGNIGETEEEMLYLPKFSREIGVDTVGFSKLRVEKHSPLREVVEKTPGYHLTDKGQLYSDAYSHAELKKIHRKLKFSFYTPVQLLKIGTKFLQVGFFSFKEVLPLLFVWPILLKKTIAREMHKNRFGDSLKRIFGNNT